LQALPAEQALESFKPLASSMIFASAVDATHSVGFILSKGSAKARWQSPRRSNPALAIVAPEGQ
jgi:hypothetical protein